MGVIFSRFRKKVPTRDKLENIQNEIDKLQEYGVSSEQKRKRLIGYLAFIMVFIGFCTAICCFFYLPTTFEERMFLSTYIVGILVLIYYLKRILSWYFRRQIVVNEKKLSNLIKEKEKILDEVMETETYKVAKEILEIYAPESFPKTTIQTSPTVLSTPAKASHIAHQVPGSEVRRRIVATPRPNLTAGGGHISPNSGSFVTPRPPVAPYKTKPLGAARLATPIGLIQGRDPFNVSVGLSSTPARNWTGDEGLQSSNSRSLRAVPPGPPMPRPILPRERGILDRFVEYLVGDGPSNRYALVCAKCESHNGMALKDEFEYIAFRCAYCYHWNPARKQRPAAPKIETFKYRPLAPVILNEEEDVTDNNSDAETKVEEDLVEKVEGEKSKLKFDEEAEENKSNNSSSRNSSSDSLDILEEEDPLSTENVCCAEDDRDASASENDSQDALSAAEVEEELSGNLDLPPPGGDTSASSFS